MRYRPFFISIGHYYYSGLRIRIKMRYNSVSKRDDDRLIYAI